MAEAKATAAAKKATQGDKVDNSVPEARITGAGIPREQPRDFSVYFKSEDKGYEDSNAIVMFNSRSGGIDSRERIAPFTHQSSHPDLQGNYLTVRLDKSGANTMPLAAWRYLEKALENMTEFERPDVKFITIDRKFKALETRTQMYTISQLWDVPMLNAIAKACPEHSSLVDQRISQIRNGRDTVIKLQPMDFTPPPPML